jgi:outer membrane protein assembly factor BamB
MEKNLYIGSNGHVCAINPHTGEEIWRTKLQDGVLAATKYEDVSIIVREGVIYAGSCGHLFALDATGQILWHNALKGLGHNDIALAFEGHTVQFLQKTVHRQSSSG